MSVSIAHEERSFSFYDFPFSCKLLLIFSFLEAIGGGISYHIAYFFSVNSVFNKLAIGWLGSSMGVGAIIGSIFGGYYTGKIEIKNLVLASFLSMGAAFGGLSCSSTLLISMVLVFFLGFGINLFLTANNAALLSLANKNNNSPSLTQSYKFSFENYGGIVAMALIMIAAQHYFKSIMASLGVFFVVLAFAVKTKLEISNKDINKDSDDSNVETKVASLIFILMSVFFVGLTFGIQKTVLGVHLHETIGSAMIIGVFFATDPVLIALFQVKLTKKLGNVSTLALTSSGCFLLGLSTLFMGYSNTKIEMFISLIIFTLGEMLFMVNSINLCDKLGGNNHRGLGIGAWRSAYSLGMMIGPLIAGLSMHYISNHSAWIISSLLCTAGAFLILNIKESQSY